MCGRFYISDDELNEINKTLRKIDRANQPYRTGEIFPTNTAPIINTAGITPMAWGFEKWNSKGVIINARSETASEKKMFSKSLRERRCVIPASGFFEWQKRDANKPKSKFLFTSNESPVMYMAGLYNNDADRFVILTRDANISIADIHDRMPVIVRDSEVDSWLSDASFVDFVINRDNIVLNRSLVS